MLLLSSLSFYKRKLLRWYSTFKIGLLVHEKQSKKFKNSGLKKTGKNLLFVLNKSVVFIHSSKYAAIISYPIRCKNKHQIPICLKKLIFRPPAGCLQYLTGNTGRITSFNFGSDKGNILALQLYTVCIRKSPGAFFANQLS